MSSQDSKSGPNSGGPPQSPRELIVITHTQAGLRSRGTAIASTTGANIASLSGLLAEHGASLIPAFGNEDRIQQAWSAAPADIRAVVAEPATYYRVAADDEKIDKLCADLLNQKLVECAYIKPPASPPVMLDSATNAAPGDDAPPATPDFTARQIYLNAAPAGIDAKYAWTRPGGKGQGVRIIDIEGAWRFSHEDLVQNQGGVIGGTQSTDLGWRNHGTAVVGEFGGDENAIGVTGICPQANVRAISIFGAGQSTSKAITDAANALSPGDIILIELHRPGPRFNYQNRNDQRGFIAIEFWPDDFAAILFATSVRNVLVVEAAGNGAENLDDVLYNTRPASFPATWTNPFNLANRQSGAIIVGAGAPPPGTHGRDHGPDRSRLDFSNFGSRVDVQGWGREVTTTGGRSNLPGDLQGGTDENLWYTDTFSGTSSASPIVVGALGCIQGGLRAKSKPVLTSATARDLLRTTGSVQQDAPTRPATQRIGRRPDLKAAFQKLGLGKTIIKEIKEKDLKDKDFKDGKEKDIKDLKEKDLKDGKEKDIKEFKEHHKEFKEKEFKEHHKEFKEKDKDKDIFEHSSDPRNSVCAGGQSPASLEGRLGQLEQTVSQLAHFIRPEQRPDLQGSPLRNEEDLIAMSRQLEQQAAEAKAVKDDKDLEKLRDQ